MNQDLPMPEMSETPKGFMARVRAMSGRTKLLIVIGIVLAVLFVFPGGCSDVNIEQEDAIATARAQLDAHPRAFEPERTESRVLRQGFPPRAMWVVVFTVPDPDGGREDFLHHAAIWVDAETGEVREVQVDEPEDG